MDSETPDDLTLDGCIHSIHVRNFFCHDNLEVCFNKNVNFIVGRNGSGKSAILTALVVGLGSRANVTGRGSSLTSFIKRGANSAVVEIKIKNSGSNAYKHNLYGDYITIERTIHSSGSSTYKIKSESGRVIADKFDEVKLIVQAHNIQVDNPISVLNQDDARTFHAADAKKKYALFRKATSLDQTENNYKTTKAKCESTLATWSMKREANKELEKEVKKLQTTFDNLQSEDEIENKKQQLQNEYYWSEIVELEKQAYKEQEKYDEMKKENDIKVRKMQMLESSLGNNNDAISSLKCKLEEKQQLKSTLAQELAQLEEESAATGERVRKADDTAAMLVAKQQRKMKTIADLRAAIQNLDPSSGVSRRAQLEEEARRAAASAAEARARYATSQLDASRAADAAHAADAHARRDADALAAQRQRTDQYRRQLRELSSSNQDPLATYGGKMVELCRQVDLAYEAGMFNAKPKGPVGRFLKVKDKKWGGTLEHIIGGSIRNFCVASDEDSRKLIQLMAKVYGNEPKPGVTSSQFFGRVHDVRAHSVRAPGHQSALAALQVADPDVANFLIDNCALEKVLLVEDHEVAKGLTDTAENVPANCSRVVTLDCTEYMPAPNYRCYGGAPRHAKYLYASTDERHRELQAQLSTEERQLSGLESAAQASKAAARQAAALKAQTARDLEVLMDELLRRERAMNDANAALEQQSEPELSVLTDELNNLQREFKQIQSQLAEINQSKQEQSQKLDDYKINMETVREKLNKVTIMCRNLSEDIYREQMKVDRYTSQRQNYTQMVEEAQSRLDAQEGKLQEWRAKIQEKTDQARQLCERVENPRERSVVASELRKAEQRIAAVRAMGVSKDEVATKLLELSRRYQANKQELDTLHELALKIQASVEKHMSYCHKVQTLISRRMQQSFYAILNLRGLSGEMSVDGASGTLEIKCSASEPSPRRTTQTSALSGGERSYSTVAFIMALWDCVELPFYFLDEFDVFMDNVNRKIIMDLLIDHAKKNKNRQFVFLTPQDASWLVSGSQIKIHRMADPLR